LTAAQFSKWPWALMPALSSWHFVDGLIVRRLPLPGAAVVGTELGETVGSAVGSKVGERVGLWVGEAVGSAVWVWGLWLCGLWLCGLWR